YISDRWSTDKAIDLIDEAGSKVRLRSFAVPPHLKALEDKLENVRSEKNAAVSGQEFEKAASLRDTEQKLKDEIEATRKNWKEDQGKAESKVSVDD
ncbi:UvrB/UvrC motif-containing protein, partial [Lysinibacillus fusiformis]|uniref:UvrB/UvrC motif-containing protein n=1 Tax=Lysinibacillus fusiformis TaxID=28031 RepID=UPI00201C50AA